MEARQLREFADRMHVALVGVLGDPVQRGIYPADVLEARLADLGARSGHPPRDVAIRSDQGSRSQLPRRRSPPPYYGREDVGLTSAREPFGQAEDVRLQEWSAPRLDARGLHRLPDLRRGERHVDVPDPEVDQGIDHGVHIRRRRADRG